MRAEPGVPSWAEQRVQLGLERASSTSSVSFRPPGANSFTPLSSKRLCDAEITAPAACSSAASHATAGVGTTPSDVTCTPSDVSPATNADSSNGPDSRVSRPTTNCHPPSTACGGATEREHQLRREVEVGDAANAVSPELQHGRACQRRRVRP